jgi:hypothetical protein
MKTLCNASQAIEKISDKSDRNFGLYYSKYGFGGLNIKRANSGYSISNLILNEKDIETLESFLLSKGIVSEYSITKAGTWARCQTSIDKKDMVELAKYLRANKISFGK